MVQLNCCISTSVVLLFLTKFLRMFSYGSLAPVFYNYLISIGFSIERVGILMTAILLGDFGITLNLTTRADTFGRKNVLLIGALLKFFAGICFALSNNFWILVLAGVIGVISTSGGEIGPFVSVEQASLTDSIIHKEGEESAKARIPVVFGWYNAMGYGAQALGALFAGNMVNYLEKSFSYTQEGGMRFIIYSYAFIGIAMALMYCVLGEEIESPKMEKNFKFNCRMLLPKVNVGLRRKESVFIVGRLSALFAIDAFAGGFVMQTWIALWFSQTWNVEEGVLGDMLSIANIVAGISGISASYFVNKFGAINTMVWTHLPSNVFLILVPLMVSKNLAIIMLIARFCISQMDVPARQSYVAMVVASDERSAAGGITNIARSVGLLLAPTITGYLSTGKPGTSMFNSPWYIAGGLKIIYDLTLWAMYNISSGLKNAEASNESHTKEEREIEVVPFRPLSSSDHEKKSNNSP